MAGLFNSLAAALVLRAFVQHLIAICSRPEAASDVISRIFVGPIVPDKSVKFSDPRTNHSREISPEAVGGIWTVFHYNLRPEVDSYDIFNVAVDYVSMDVRVKFDDSRSNGS